MTRNKTLFTLIGIFLFLAFITTFNYGGCGGGSGGDNGGSSGLLPPAQVTSPNPANSAINIPITQTLTWASATGATSYNVYFGITTTGWLPVTNTIGTSYDPGTLSYDTTYYWRISSKNSGGVTAGIVWNFTTTLPPWTKQFGTASSDVAYGVATDTSGNIYVAGYTNGGLDGNTNAGGSDVFVVKYNSTGEKQWTRQFGTADYDDDRGVATDPNSNIYVVGYTKGGLDGNTNTGQGDAFVVKYNPAGVKQWTKQFGTIYDDSASGVVVDASENIYVSGSTYGGLDGNTNGGSDVFVVKYNSAGEKQWTKQFGSSSNDGASAVAIDVNGNIFVAGYTNGGLDGNNAGGSDVFVVKYNSTGEKQWIKQFGTSSDDLAYDVAVDINENIYVTGWTYGGLDGNTNAGGSDVFVVKYNSASEKQWTRQFGTASSEDAFGVAADLGGNIYVTGYTRGGLDGNTNAGFNDSFVVKYNSAGVKQWTKQFGTASWDSASDVATDPSGNIYVVGTTSGGLDGNTSAGLSDGFVLKYNSAGEKQ